MTLTPGTRLGPFEIVSLLGAGGMGEVYRAQDTRLDRTVAIKVLNDLSTEATGPSAIDRFQREARAIARISHPNICTLHDLGQEGSTTFLVMEYVEGATLARRLEEGRLPLRTVLDIAIPIADALDHAHRQGVVHRDLKPGNVMIAHGQVKLLDFGLAKIIRPEDSAATDVTRATVVTERGAVLGTLPYMAPEQIEGGAVDARTDIFSFGIVLYEMLAGRRPFASDSRASLMLAIVSLDPPPLSELAPLTLPSLQRVVARCLAKNPDDRWQTARDLSAELRWIAEGGSVAESKVPAMATVGRRRSFWLGGLLGATLAALSLAGAAVLMWPRATTPTHDPVTYRRGAVSSARFTPDGENIVYSASWEGKPYDLFLGRQRTADARSLGLEGGRIMSISRSGEMAAVFGPQNTIGGLGSRTLARIPLAGGGRRDLLDGIEEADWIPGTSDLAVVRRGAGDMAVVEFPTGTKVHEARSVWSMRVSPDGQHVAFFEGPQKFDMTGTGILTVVSRSGAKSTLTRGWSALGLAWAPSSKEVWFTGTRGQRPPALHAVSLSGRERAVYAAPDWLVLHDISTNGSVLLTRNSIDVGILCQGPGETSERDLSWLFGSRASDVSADGRTLIFSEGLGATASGIPAVFRRNIAGGPAVQIGEGSPYALSPDGAWTLVNKDDTLLLLPTGAGSARTLKKMENAQVREAGWLPDSTHVVFAAIEAGVVRGYVQDVVGGPARPFTPAGVSIATRALPPDGRAVLGRAGDQWSLYPLDGGAPKGVSTLMGTDVPLR